MKGVPTGDQDAAGSGVAAAIAVAGAATVRLDVGDPIEHIRTLGGKIPNARPSMLLDPDAGRRGEVAAINGSIPCLGKRYDTRPRSTRPSSRSPRRGTGVRLTSGSYGRTSPVMRRPCTVRRSIGVWLTSGQCDGQRRVDGPHMTPR